MCTSSQEQCDGRDNDCDGATDENLDQPCANQKGICTGSTAACLNGSYASCGAQQYSSDYEKTETSCDGKDNDCDGTVDENCSCTDGATQKCGSNTGICSKGSQTCTKGSWGTCTGETEPNSSETCDGKDDDCDGSTDEHLTTTCSNQNGVCAGSTISCQNGQFPSCGASEFGSDYESNESTCDNLDNDCDGSVDESLTKPCSNQTGICQGSTRSCSGGSYPSCGPSDYGGQYEDPETSCDGFDNDCDGTVDESQTLRTFDFEGSDPAGWSKIPSGASNLNVDSDATSGGAAQGSEYAKAWYKHGTCKPVAGIGASFSVSGTIDQITLDARVDVPNWGHASIFLRDSNGNTTTLWTAMGKGNGYQTQGWKTLTFDHTTNSNTTTSNGAEIRRNAIPSGVGNGTVTLIFGNDDDSGYCTYGDHTWTTRVDDVKVKSTCP